MSDRAERGILGYLRMRWLDKAKERMEADPEYQRVAAENQTATEGTTSWNLLMWEADSGYLNNRPWYWHFYWWQEKMRGRFYRAQFYIRRHVLGIHRPKGYWHYTHAEKLICPDCDRDNKWCSEDPENHACIAEILEMAEVHAAVDEGKLMSPFCAGCGVACPK